MVKQLFLIPSLFILTLAPASGISLLFDYRYDSTGFFTPERRNTLEAAGQWFGSRLTDSLTAIVPMGGNTWTQEFDDPSTGTAISLLNQVVPADSLLIYVGAADLGCHYAGRRWTGRYTVSGSVGWLDVVQLRGQIGGEADPPTDFATWGGTITFDTTTDWYADQDLTAMEAGLGFDLYSTALHEIAHVLGFGTALSFNTQIDFDEVTFTGEAATVVYGSNPPLANEAHWYWGTESVIFGTNTLQNVAMDPAIPTGVRKHMTELDMAGIRDIGWIVVPEPSAGILLASAFGCLALRRKRRRSR